MTDWPTLIARVHAGERARDVAREHGINGRVLWMKALNADPEFAEAHRQRGRQRMKALHADPEFAAAHRQRLKSLNADPEFAAARRRRLKALHADPEFAAAHRQRSRQKMKALNADPEFNPLAALTDAERSDYDALKRSGFSRAEALTSIGRADLLTGQERV